MIESVLKNHVLRKRDISDDIFRVSQSLVPFEVASLVSYEIATRKDQVLDHA